MSLKNEVTVPCPFEEPCCMKWENQCTALTDTRFPDKKCHFRKTWALGDNQYDKEKRNDKRRDSR